MKCKIDGCIKKSYTFGLCSMHLWRFRFHGDPNWIRNTPEQRYHLGYEKRGEDECWNWIKGQTCDGYGKFVTMKNAIRKTWIASRFGWTITFGEIPKDMLVCHTCDNPLCQNPKHWFLGTTLDNMRDKMTKGRFKGNKFGINGCKHDPINGRFIGK